VKPVNSEGSLKDSGPAIRRSTQSGKYRFARVAYRQKLIRLAVFCAILQRVNKTVGWPCSPRKTGVLAGFVRGFVALEVAGSIPVSPLAYCSLAGLSRDLRASAALPPNLRLRDVAMRVASSFSAGTSAALSATLSVSALG